MILDLFNNIYSNTQSAITPLMFMIVVALSLVSGAMYFASNIYKGNYSISFLTTMAILPTVVCVVIMMVNGNIGIGVAVAGAFSLVRFRSQPGTAKEICLLFMGMCSGLICGVGYCGYSILFTLIMCVLCVVFNIVTSKYNEQSNMRLVKVVCPESLNYEDCFKEVFDKYTKSVKLNKVKTTNLGSLYSLTYLVVFKPNVSQKEFMDELRVRNGNLEIMINQIETGSEL